MIISVLLHKEKYKCCQKLNSVAFTQESSQAHSFFQAQIFQRKSSVVPQQLAVLSCKNVSCFGYFHYLA